MRGGGDGGQAGPGLVSNLFSQAWGEGWGPCLLASLFPCYIYIEREREKFGFLLFCCGFPPPSRAASGFRVRGFSVGQLLEFCVRGFVDFLSFFVVFAIGLLVNAFCASASAFTALRF